MAMQLAVSVLLLFAVSAYGQSGTDFTSDVDLLLTPNATGIIKGRFFYSFGQGAYRFSTSAFSELYTYFVPPIARPRRWSCLGYGFGCLDNQNITTTVISNNPTSPNYTISYTFIQLRGGCPVGQILLNVPPPCVDISKIIAVAGPDSGCSTKIETKPIFSFPCRYFEGIRYPFGGIRINIVSKYGATCNQLNVTFPGAVPGDGMLGLYSKDTFFGIPKCGSVQSTVFVCTHVHTPQLKFTNSSTCKCETGAPVFGGAPVLFQDNSTYALASLSTLPGCNQFDVKPNVNGPVKTLWLNQTSGLPCAASFADGRQYTFKNVKASPVPSSVLAQPTVNCNCTTPLDIALVLDQFCSFYDFDMIRYFASELVMNFFVSSRYTQFSVYRAHYSAFQALKLTKGLTVLNVISAIKSLGCCGTWRSDDDDDNSCCSNSGGLAQSIKLAADELAQRPRNFSTPAIVALTSKLTDPNLPSVLQYIQTNYPDIVVYFVTTRYDDSWLPTKLINDDVFTFINDLGNTTNYRVWSRTDWLFWTRLRLMLVGAICSQNPFPCGKNCCGLCVCGQCISPDACIQPPANACVSVEPVKGCCSQVPICVSDDPCFRKTCNNSVCVSTPVCPSQDQCYVYTCNATALQCQQTPNTAFQQLLDQAKIPSKNCSQAICTPDGPKLFTTQVCSVNSDVCGLTSTTCGASGKCETVPNQLTNGCTDVTCAGVTDVKSCRTGATRDFMEGPNVINGTAFPVCDANGGICKAVPLTCNLCQRQQGLSCLDIPLNEICPFKKNFTAFQCDGSTGSCSYLPAICPSSDCGDPTVTPDQIKLVQNGSVTQCLTPVGVDLGTIYQPSTIQTINCLNQPGCEAFVPNPLSDCGLQVKECKLGLTGYSLVTAGPGNGDFCKAVASADPCIVTGICTTGQCSLTPVDCSSSLPPDFDSACQVAQRSFDDTTLTCTCTATPLNCTGQNACFDYTCLPHFGCLGLEKCASDKCFIRKCNNSQTGTCADLDPIIPPEFDSPCFIRQQCDRNVGWNFTNFCDDNNTLTIDVCTPTTPTPTCTYVCNDNNPCTAEIYDDQNRTCIIQELPCNITVPPIDQSALTSSLITALDCNDNDACTDGRPFNDSCIFTPVNCTDDDPCTIDSCDPFLGCVHLDMMCDDGSSQVGQDKCSVSFCQVVYNATSGQKVGVCVTQPMNCISSVRTQVIVGSALSAAAILGIAIACVAIFLCTGTGAYYVKLNLQPEEEAETNWNALYERAQPGEGARRGAANPLHKRH